tara:strand:- start:10370 stop:10495 length:126 start_codon:yes stop_codon:yes gene_type:complete
MVGDEEWANGHMGTMAFYRTGISVVNLFLSVLVILKVFEVI